MPGTSKISQMFPVRLLHADRHKLDQMAEAAGVSRGEVVKRLLRSATAEQVAGGIGDGAEVSTDARTAPQVVQ
jgi:hypothetical protein